MKPSSTFGFITTALLRSSYVLAASVSSKGCFSSTNGLTLNGSQTFNSIGACSTVCLGLKAPAMAMQDSNCYCGSKLPPTNSAVDDSKCSISCPGYPSDNCGGEEAFSVYLTGLSAVVGNADSSDSDTSQGSSGSSTSKPSVTPAAAPSVVTVGGQTVVVTANPESSNTSLPVESSGGKSNKAGIAAGVVVGLLIFAGIIGGFVLVVRNRKRRAIEAEHRQAAAVNSFIDGGKSPMPVSDTRLDPTVMASRRMSDGSIADNQDYSRRILKVTNA